MVLSTLLEVKKHAFDYGTQHLHYSHILCYAQQLWPWSYGDWARKKRQILPQRKQRVLRKWSIIRTVAKLSRLWSTGLYDFPSSFFTIFSLWNSTILMVFLHRNSHVLSSNSTPETFLSSTAFSVQFPVLTAEGRKIVTGCCLIWFYCITLIMGLFNPSKYIFWKPYLPKQTVEELFVYIRKRGHFVLGEKK